LSKRGEPMSAQEFWDTYRSSQKKITMPEYMCDSLREQAKKPRRTGIAQYQEHLTLPDSSPIQDQAVLTLPDPDFANNRIHHGLRSNRNLRIITPLAACLVLVALMVSLASFFGGTNDPDETPTIIPPNVIIPEILPSNFIVKAYAAEIDSFLEPGPDNQIIFNRTLSQYYGVVAKEAYLSTEGYYTGCLFQIEGEDIARIQASISTGVLYQYSQERITRGDNIERWQELLNWKPSSRGIGKYYGKYDSVQILGALFDGIEKDDPDKQVTVALSKRLGSTIDVFVDAASPQYSYGFWTNKDYGNIPNGDAAVDAIMDLFDGAKLTITVTFADGKTSTQVIELHAGNVRSTLGNDENGVMIVTLTTELIDFDISSLTRFLEYTHTLYGIVIETNDGPFPGSLDSANELEFVVSAPMPLPHLELIQQVISGFNPKDIHPSKDVLHLVLGSNHDHYSITGLVAARSKTLPDGLTLDDLWTGAGSWEYFNLVTSQVDGYTLDEFGTPSEGFSWVMLEATLTNESDSAVWLWPDGRFYGDIAFLDSRGRLNTLTTRSCVLLGKGWGTSEPERLLIYSHESRTIRWLLIVPDFALDEPTLVFLPAGYGYYYPLEGFELNL